MPLESIGTASLVFGILSLARHVTNAVCFAEALPMAHPSMFVWFDGTVATLWILSGLSLRSRAPNLRSSAMAAGVAAARTILSALLLGPDLIRAVLKRKDHTDFVPDLCAAASQVLHYGIEFLAWPVVIFAVFKACDAPRPRWQPDRGLSTGLAFAGAAVIGAIFQAALLAPSR